MRLIVAPAFLVAALVMSLGCSEPAFTPAKVRVGMTEEQAVAVLGRPAATVVQGATTYLEYETYDQDRWFGGGRKENVQVFVVRLIGGRVDAVGKKGEVEDTKAPSTRIESYRKPGAEPAAVPFDLRSELEKLEKMKRDGLITEAEYKDLRQRVLDKARSQ
ncbi:MAG TPA: hypothetical protein VGJ89_09970 [Geothrix sp.]|jgi:hypothetical protein